MNNTSTRSNTRTSISSIQGGSSNLWDPNAISASYFDSLSRSRLNQMDNSNNASLIISNRSDVNTRLAPHRTPPLRQGIQMPDSIKYSFTIQHSRALKNSNTTMNTTANTTSNTTNTTANNYGLNLTTNSNNDSRRMEITNALRRNPSPTLPMRSINAKKSFTINTELESNRSNVNIISIEQNKENVDRTNVPLQQSNNTINPPVKIDKPRERSKSIDKSQQRKQPINTSSLPYDHLLQWMKSIGVPIKSEADHMDLIDGFKTGITLAELVQKLEHMDLKGIDNHPKQTAAKQNNINRALEILRQRKNMNHRYLWAVDDIIKGNEQVIWGLINDIYNDYMSLQRKAKRPQVATVNNMKSRIPISKRRAVQFAKAQAEASASESVSVAVHSDILNGNTLCTEDMEKEAKTWLRDLNFDVLLSGKESGMFKDVLRNGVFLCELVGTLEKRPVKDVNRNPIILKDAKQNIERAMRILRQKNIPPVYLHSEDKILKGQLDFIWGLIYHIMRVYPQAKQNFSMHYSNNSSSLYSADYMKRLEQSVLFWLRSLGMFVDRAVPSTLSDIEFDITNGTLLCELVGFVVGERIIGVHKNPKVSTSKLANINKALEPLRRRKGVSQRFLWKDEEVLNGDKCVILGLLEDIHKFYDGVNPKSNSKDQNIGKSSGTTSDEAIRPYLGNSTLSDPFVNNFLFDQSGTNGIQGNKFSMERIEEMAKETLHGRGRIAIPATPPTQLRPTMPTPTKLTTARDPQRLFPEPFFPSSKLSNILLPEPTRVESSVTEITNNIPGMQHKSGGAGLLTTEYLRHSTLQLQDLSKLSDEVLIAKWLESLGVQLQSIFSLESPICPEFCDGTVLCKIVGALQHKEVEGVTHNPKKTPSYLHNIRKALEVLRRKKNMPIDYLWSEQDILRGDSKVITKLLIQIRKAYGHHYK
jgi:hypothetical protein